MFVAVAGSERCPIFASQEEKSGREERGQISTFDIRVLADVIRRNAKAEGKLSLTAD